MKRYVGIYAVKKPLLQTPNYVRARMGPDANRQKKIFK